MEYKAEIEKMSKEIDELKMFNLELRITSLMLDFYDQNMYTNAAKEDQQTAYKMLNDLKDFLKSSQEIIKNL